MPLIPATAACDSCGALKGQTNHWFCTKASLNEHEHSSILVMPFSLKRVEDGWACFCGQDCLMKQLSKDLPEFWNSTKPVTIIGAAGFEFELASEREQEQAQERQDELDLLDPNTCLHGVSLGVECFRCNQILKTVLRYPEITISDYLEINKNIDINQAIEDSLEGESNDPTF